MGKVTTSETYLVLCSASVRTYKELLPKGRNAESRTCVSVTKVPKSVNHKSTVTI